MGGRGAGSAGGGVGGGVGGGGALSSLEKAVSTELDMEAQIEALRGNVKSPELAAARNDTLRDLRREAAAKYYKGPDWQQQRQDAMDKAMKEERRVMERYQTLLAKVQKQNLKRRAQYEALRKKQDAFFSAAEKKFGHDKFVSAGRAEYERRQHK